MSNTLCYDVIYEIMFKCHKEFLVFPPLSNKNFYLSFEQMFKEHFLGGLVPVDTEHCLNA